MRAARQAGLVGEFEEASRLRDTTLGKPAFRGVRPGPKDDLEFMSEWLGNQDITMCELRSGLPR